MPERIFTHFSTQKVPSLNSLSDADLSQFGMSNEVLRRFLHASQEMLVIRVEILAAGVFVYVALTTPSEPM